MRGLFSVQVVYFRWYCTNKKLSQTNEVLFSTHARLRYLLRSHHVCQREDKSPSIRSLLQSSFTIPPLTIMARICRCCPYLLARKLRVTRSYTSLLFVGVEEITLGMERALQILSMLSCVVTIGTSVLRHCTKPESPIIVRHVYLLQPWVNLDF